MQLGRYPVPVKLVDADLGVIVLVGISQEALSSYVAHPLESWCWEHSADGWWIGLSLVDDAALFPLVRFNLADSAHRAALGDLLQRGCPLRIRPAAAVEGDEIVGTGIAVELRQLDRIIIGAALSF
jgi:hypothetical protein